MFFVATAPLAADGLVNLSPKGPIGSLAIVDDHTVAYLDVTGSGAETIAHLRENGRIVDHAVRVPGPAAHRALSRHAAGPCAGTSRTSATGSARCDFEDASIPQARRSVIVVDVERVSDSCGYGVPLMAFEGVREHHALSSAKKLRVMGQDGYDEYLRTKNARSLDGLPAVD